MAVPRHHCFSRMVRRTTETEIHALGANVKEQVSGCRNSMARARANFMEGMEFARTWRAEERVPGIGAEAHDAGESTIEGAETDGAKQAREIRAERKDRDTIFGTGIDGDDKKNCDFGEWRGNELRER